MAWAGNATISPVSRLECLIGLEPAQAAGDVSYLTSASAICRLAEPSP